MSTREKIKEEALKLFAERGFDGVSVRDIARAADANVSAVSYHFGGKEELLREVVSDGLAAFRAVLSSIGGEDLPLKNKVERLLEAFLFFLQKEDSVSRIIFSELSMGGDRLPDLAEEHFRLVMSMFSDMLRRGVESGEIRDTDATLTMMQFVSMPVHLVYARPIVEMMRGKKGYSNAFIKQVVRHTVDVMFNGIAAQKTTAKRAEK
jgi:AcrR family transcriptional regulator